MATELSGWLKKSHASAPYRSSSRKRFFRLQGFHVYYYSADPAKGGAVRGHFDLRNVVHISPVDEKEAPDAIRLRIAEGSADQVRKMTVISFEVEPGRRTEWLEAWCSAISRKYVHQTLAHHISPPLASRFNASFGHQEGMGSRRSLISALPPRISPLTSRDQQADMTPCDGAQTPSLPLFNSCVADRLDTPRTAADPAQVTYEVTVPQGAMPGDKLKMQLPTGPDVQITIPKGAAPGTVLSFELPESAGSERMDRAAMIIQARIRGIQARRKYGIETGVAVASSDEQTLGKLPRPVVWCPTALGARVHPYSRCTFRS